MRASTPSGSALRTGSAAVEPAVPTGDGQLALRAQHLSKSYHSPVLRDLDLDVEQGQFVAIMGPLRVWEVHPSALPERYGPARYRLGAPGRPGDHEPE